MPVMLREVYLKNSFKSDWLIIIPPKIRIFETAFAKNKKGIPKLENDP